VSEKKVRMSTTAAAQRDATPELTLMIVGNIGSFVNVISYASFGSDRFRAFRSIRGPKWPSRLLKQYCALHRVVPYLAYTRGNEAHDILLQLYV
jgi:hypothetical protein